MTQSEKILLTISTIIVVLFSASAISNSSVNEASISEPGGEWLNYGRDYKEQRFSPLKQINVESVAQLGLEWSYTFPTSRVMEATPLMHQGVLYVTTPWSQVFAIDAKNGKLLWQYDPEVPKSHLINGCCGPANRGVALWQNDKGEKSVFVGSFDGRLIALNAHNGEQRWSVRTVEKDSHYTITGAPRVVAGKVIIGNGGAELGVRGYVSAYDVDSGEIAWRFYTVPGKPDQPQENEALEKALPTWNGRWWEVGGGGGTVWDAMAYDPKLDLLYIGTGNGSPWNRDIRSPGGGDNLYLNSIIALRPKTGEYVWHYQVTPKDNWDYTATQHLILAELSFPDKREVTPVIMQAPKNGFFYVLDRRDGKLLSAEAYGQINWASHIDMSTGRPVETPVADYNKTGGSLIWPAPFGAHNWHPMSYSQQTGLVYIPVQHGAAYYSPDKRFSFNKHRWNTGIDFWELRYHDDPVVSRASYDAMVRGYLTAWNPLTQQKVWQVEHRHPYNGGVLSTAGGLVFQGTGENGFHAYDASNGEELWSYQADSAVLAGPISYTIDGEQYVAVTQGSGGTMMLVLGKSQQSSMGNPNRLLVFKLGGGKELENDLLPAPQLPLLPESDYSAEQIDQGEKLYERNCTTCHGNAVNGSGIVPDLRYMSVQTHQDFQAIVLGGLRSHKGMVGFSNHLTSDQVESIHAYINSRNQRLHEVMELSLWDTARYWYWYWVSRLGDRYPWIANWGRDLAMEE